MRQILYNAWIEPIPETVFKLFRWLFSPFRKGTVNTQKSVLSPKSKIIICISLSIALFSCVVLISLITGNDIGFLNSVKDAVLNLGIPVFSGNAFYSTLTETDISILSGKTIHNWGINSTMLIMLIGFFISYFVEKEIGLDKLFIGNFHISYYDIIISTLKWTLIFVAILFCEKIIPYIIKYPLLYFEKNNIRANSGLHITFILTYWIVSFCLLYNFLENYASMLCKLFIVAYMHNEILIKNFAATLALCVILDFIFAALKRIPLIDTAYRSIFNYIRRLLSPRNYAIAAMFFTTMVFSLLQNKNR